jgi:hypothetical protein
MKMNRYIVFYQTSDDELSRTYQEIDADTVADAENTTLAFLSDNQTIISVWQKVT